MISAKLLAHPYWVFDLDGTLTKPILDFPKIKRQLGLPLDRGILEVLQEMDPDEAVSIHRDLEMIEHEMAHRAEAAPGAADLLEHLKSRGTKLGILTRNKKDHALRTLEVTRMSQFFSEADILGRDEAEHKPSPDGLQKLKQKWKAPDHWQGVMAGDFLFDLQAGRAAGLKTLYVDANGAFPYQDYATLSVRSLTELLPESG